MRARTEFQATKDVRRPHTHRALLVAGSANALPLAASLIRAGTEHYLPTSDWALIELQVRAVGTRATPLLGAWSRFGWRHPGPLAFYLLAVPYRAFGGAPAALQVGAVLINAAAIGLTLALLARRGSAAVLVGGAALLLMQCAFAGALLRDEWNASLPVLPFVLLLVASWEARSSSLAVAVVPLAATFVMQTHVAYMALSLPALVVWSYAARQRPRPAIVACTVAGVLWLPVLLDTALHAGGNLRKIAAWSFARHPTALGITGAWHAFGAALLVVVLLVLRRRYDDRRLTGLLLATWAAGFLATAHISRPYLPWLTWWIVPLTALSFIALAIPLVERAPRSLSAFTAMLLLATAPILALRAGTADPHGATLHDTVVKFGRAARAVGDDRPLTIERDGPYNFTTGALQAALAARLAHTTATPKIETVQGAGIFDRTLLTTAAEGHVVLLTTKSDMPTGRLLAAAIAPTPVGSAPIYLWLIR